MTVQNGRHTHQSVAAAAHSHTCLSTAVWFWRSKVAILSLQRASLVHGAISQSSALWYTCSFDCCLLPLSSMIRVSTESTLKIDNLTACRLAHRRTPHSSNTYHRPSVINQPEPIRISIYLTYGPTCPWSGNFKILTRPPSEMRDP